VALQDHFKWLKKTEEIEKEKEEPKQELDLKFKEGETIKINMKITVSTYTLGLGRFYCYFLIPNYNYRGLKRPPEIEDSFSERLAFSYPVVTVPSIEPTLQNNIR
jgi:Protein of unknown function (DUF1681).